MKGNGPAALGDRLIEYALRRFKILIVPARFANRVDETASSYVVLIGNLSDICVKLEQVFAAYATISTKNERLVFDVKHIGLTFHIENQVWNKYSVRVAMQKTSWDLPLATVLFVQCHPGPLEQLPDEILKQH